MKKENHDLNLNKNEPNAKSVTLNELPGGESKSGKKLLDGNLSVIAGVKVKVEVIVGSTEISIEELFALEAGSNVVLDQLYDAPLTLRLEGQPIATGRLVVIDDSFGLCIDQINKDSVK